MKLNEAHQFCLRKELHRPILQLSHAVTMSSEKGRRWCSSMYQSQFQRAAPAISHILTPKPAALRASKARSFGFRHQIGHGGRNYCTAGEQYAPPQHTLKASFFSRCSHVKRAVLNILKFICRHCRSLKIDHCCNALCRACGVDAKDDVDAYRQTLLNL